MKLKKVIALTMTAAMLTMVAAGCGDKSAGTKTTDTGSATTADTKKDSAADETKNAGDNKDAGESKKLTVSVWDNESSPQFKSVTEAFMTEYPNVEIELIDTQADEYNNKLTVMLAGGDSDPDVIFVKDSETQVTMKDKGQLLNLDEYISRDNVDLSVYGGVAEELKMDGSSYTLPFRKDWYVLYYNKDLFDKAGVPYPSDDMTWTEYEELAKKMTSGDGSGKVYGSHNHTWMAMVSNWAVQDGKNTLMSSDYSFLKPYYEQALRMQEEGVIQSYANLKTGSIHYISVFEQQQCAMIPMGSWFIGTLISDKAAGSFDFNWGVTRIPHPDGVEAGNTVGAATPIGINGKTDEPDLAWEFVKFVTSEKGASILADNGIFPALESTAISEKLATVEGFPEDGKIALTTTGFVLDRPLDANMASVRKVIEEEHDLIMIGEEDVDTGIANMNSRAKEAIDNK